MEVDADNSLHGTCCSDLLYVNNATGGAAIDEQTENLNSLVLWKSIVTSPLSTFATIPTARGPNIYRMNFIIHQPIRLDLDKSVKKVRGRCLTTSTCGA